MSRLKKNFFILHIGLFLFVFAFAVSFIGIEDVVIGDISSSILNEEGEGEDFSFILFFISVVGSEKDS